MLVEKAIPWVRVSKGCGGAVSRLQHGVPAAPVPPVKAPTQLGDFWFPIPQPLLWAVEAGVEPGNSRGTGRWWDGVTE